MKQLVHPFTFVRSIISQFFLVVFITSCIPATQYTSSVGGCPTALVSGDKILLGEVAGVTTNQAYELYKQLEPLAREAGLLPAYAVEQEMYLRMNGIKPQAAADTSNLSKMHQMGYRYYLQLSVGNSRSGFGYTSASAQENKEIQQYGNNPTNNNTTGAITFELYSTQNRKLIYTLSTNTELSGVTLPGKHSENGYRNSTSLNTGTTSMALEKSLKKGALKLLSDCNCCRE